MTNHAARTADHAARTAPDTAGAEAARSEDPIVVIGGTGMLRPAVHRLVADGGHVVVVARRPQRAFTGEPAPWQASGGQLVPVTADWADPGHLADEVAVATEGVAARAVIAWIHGPYHEDVLAALDRTLARTAVVVQLWGSALGDPTEGPAPPAMAASPRSYRRVVLGYVREGSRSRWLTDEEISAGALRALDDPSPVQVVGQVTPWSQRPGGS